MKYKEGLRLRETEAALIDQEPEVRKENRIDGQSAELLKTQQVL